MDCSRSCYWSHPGEEHRDCSSLTKRDEPCRIHADRLSGGKWVCHVHDPAGAYQANLTRSAQPIQ